MTTKILCSTAIGVALALAAANAASAQSSGSGVLGARVGTVSIDDSVGDDDFSLYGVDGAFITGDEHPVRFQVDVAYQNFDTDPSVDVWNTNGHVLFGSEMTTFGGFLTFADSDSADSTWGGGGEVRVNSGNATFGGELGYLDGDDGELWAGAGHVDVFGADNLRFGGVATLGNVDVVGADSSYYGLTGEVEWRLQDTPISFVGGVDWLSFDDYDVDALAFRIGINVDLGSRTLKQRYQEGATMRGARHLVGGYSY